MADYIDREELLKKYPYAYNEMGCEFNTSIKRKIIEEFPSVDAVEVVRCKNCINYGMCHCQRDNMFIAVEENDFCSRGVKKNEQSKI